MEKSNRTIFWKNFLISNESALNRPSQEQAITNISWGEANSEDRLVQTDQEVLVQHKDKRTGEWHTDYQKAKIAPLDYRITSGYVHALKQNVVVLSFRRGSGGYLTYTILGKQKGHVVELANKEDVYKGDIFIENGKLLEKRDSRYGEWVIQNNHVTLIPFTIPRIDGALRIEYEILPDGHFKIKKTHYAVKVGTIVQLIRTDLNSIPEQGYIDAGAGDASLIEYLPAYKEAFKIVKSGKVAVKIAPGLDWNKAVTISIEAK